jgi:hypothetical protein
MVKSINICSVCITNTTSQELRNVIQLQPVFNSSIVNYQGCCYCDVFVQ